MNSNFAWIAGGVVQNIIVADSAGTFAAAVVAAGMCDYCNSLPNGSTVDIGWTYNATANTYAAPVTH